MMTGDLGVNDTGEAASGMHSLQQQQHQRAEQKRDHEQQEHRGTRNQSLAASPSSLSPSSSSSSRLAQTLITDLGDILILQQQLGTRIERLVSIDLSDFPTGWCLMD